MQSGKKDPGLEVAVFRHGVIADALRLPERSAERAAMLRAKAKLEYDIPGTRRRRIAVSTMREWIRRFRKGGLDGLRPRPRSDQGKSRSISEEAADILKGIKQDNPRLSTRLVIREAVEGGQIARGTKLVHGTVHRLLASAGLTVPRGEQLPDMRRYCYTLAGELWQSDVLHGPKVGWDPKDRRRRRKTYLTALLDDATRVVPYAAFAFSENTDALLSVFRNGVMRRGVPFRLYVDNGANYSSRRLQVVCAHLDVCLIHSTPYYPQGKGKIERFFRTVRQQFLAPLSPEDLASLDAINRKLRVWIEGEYHRTPHRGLGDGHTPLERWAQRADRVRPLPPGIDLPRLCLPRHQRRVSKDRVVHLHGRQYEVEARLAGRRVTVIEDPDAPPARPLEVECDGEPAGHAVLLNPYANARRRPARKRRPQRQPREQAAARGPDTPSPGLPLRKLSRREEPSRAPDSPEKDL